MSLFAFRLGTLLFAALLGVQGLWLLTTEILRPNLPYMPATEADAGAITGRRMAAGVAADIGSMRGDLWTNFAIAQAADFFVDNQTIRSTSSALDSARDAAITAAALAPTDSRLWLLLALIAERSKASERVISEYLKMSYYTAPNTVALISSRLPLATRSVALADRDLQGLVDREIQTIMLRRPDLKPTLLAAYQKASPEGQRFIDAKVRDLDKTFAATIRGVVQQSLPAAPRSEANSPTKTNSDLPPASTQAVTLSAPPPMSPPLMSAPPSSTTASAPASTIATPDTGLTTASSSADRVTSPAPLPRSRPAPALNARPQPKPTN